jgi:cell division protein ZapB
MLILNTLLVVTYIFLEDKLMTFELLDKLENKIQSAVDTISLLEMEVEELKQDNLQLSNQSEQHKIENIKLNEEHQQWQSRLSALVGKIEQAEEI